MKKTLALFSILFSASVPAIADPGVFFGAVYNFGGSAGVSVKILSTNKEEHCALVAGGSYFPQTKKFGVDAGAGYLFTNGAGTIGWDFFNKHPQIGVGYVNTAEEVTAPVVKIPQSPPPV